MMKKTNLIWIILLVLLVSLPSIFSARPPPINCPFEGRVVKYEQDLDFENIYYLTVEVTSLIDLKEENFLQGINFEEIRTRCNFIIGQEIEGQWLVDDDDKKSLYENVALEQILEGKILFRATIDDFDNSIENLIIIEEFSIEENYYEKREEILDITKENINKGSEKQYTIFQKLFNWFRNLFS
jgi:hypothetical protein